jgi:hypothetical protein
LEVAAVCNHRGGLRPFGRHLGTGRIKVYDADLYVIRPAPWESPEKSVTLQTHGVMHVAVFRALQAAIRRAEYLDPGPGQPLARRISQRAETLREASIEIEINWVPGHTGMLENEEADCQVNLMGEGHRTETVSE